MKTSFLLVLLLAATAPLLVVASCPNSCSGHGTCGASDKCSCQPNWDAAADCSEQWCPFGTAWVDVALGAQDAHNLAECSGKGRCDRSTGLCECFAGFEGKSCQRQSCPNGCSGHGVCQTIEELASDSELGGSSSYTYVASWDIGMSRGCKCDAGWNGTDCSLRMCARGDDPLTTSDNYEVQKIVIADADETGGDKEANLGAGSFTLTYKDNTNHYWDSRPIRYSAGLESGRLGKGGSSTTAVLTGDSISSTDDAYNGLYIFVYGSRSACSSINGTQIADYTGSTKTVTVTAFSGTVDATCGDSVDAYFVIRGGAGHEHIKADSSDTTTVLTLSANEATTMASSYYKDALIRMENGDCSGQTRHISAHDVTNKQITVSAAFSPTTGAATKCDAANQYTIWRPVLPADVESALENLPSGVVRSVTVTASAATSTDNYELYVTFVTPSANDGRLLTVNTAGCRKAGCSPMYEGISSRVAASSTVDAGSTGISASAFTIKGIYHGQGAATSGYVSEDGYAGMLTKCEVKFSDASATPMEIKARCFEGTAWGAWSATATALHATDDLVIAELNGIVLNSGATTVANADTDDTLTITVGPNSATAFTVSDSTSGTKREDAVCSNRGTCDSTTGICKCYPGHVGVACEYQTTMA